MTASNIPSPKEVLERLLMLSPRFHETINNHYERVATEFLKDTGVLAPGKDEPAAAYPDVDEDRVLRFTQWEADIRENAKAAIPVAELHGQAMGLLKRIVKINEPLQANIIGYLTMDMVEEGHEIFNQLKERK